jgi:ribose/xylose/arabinose/galactoside ABC-type transport system permease subunit
LASSASSTQAGGERTVAEHVRRLPRQLLLSENFVLYLSILYFLALWTFIPQMGSLRNVENISSNMWPLFVLAVGQMFVLIVGGIDLSQASIMGITSVTGALLMAAKLDPVLFGKNVLWGVVISENGGLLSGNPAAVPLGIAAMLLVGVLIGLANGIAVAKFKMPPFMVTLVSMMFFSGLAIYLTRSENVMNLPKGYLAIGKGQIGPLPCSFFIALALAFVAHIILNRTLLGRWFYAVGKNIRASIISGSPVERVTILAYVVSGFCGALGAVIYSARLEAGRPTLGQGRLLDIIGAVVIGGISLFGGKGKVLWAFFGVLFFTLLSNSLNMLNLSFYTVDIVKGSIILIAAMIDVLRTRLLSKGG